MKEAVNQPNGQDLPASPNGWVWAKLGEVTEIVLGQSPPSSTYNENGNGLPFYQGKSEFGNTYPIPRKWCTSPRKITKNRDVLISVRAPVGPTNVCIEESCIGRGLAAIRGLAGIETFYILYLIRAFERDLAGKGTGTTFDAITRDMLSDLTIPIAPLAEQQRIVDKIEELFTKLDAGVEALHKVKAQLKRYRQSVLKSAFEGKLTEQWREAHKGELEPSSEMLRRAAERKSTQSKRRQESFRSLPGSELKALPHGWLYITLDQLSSSDGNSIKRGPFGSAIKKSFFVPRGYKVYEQKNVIYNDFERGSYFIDDRKFNELKDFKVQSGDVLMTCSGTVGRIAIVPEEAEPGVINQALLKITLDGEIVQTHYFVYLFTSKIDEIILENTRGSAMVNISSVKDLRQLPFPIPPIEEQRRIVEEVEKHLSIAAYVEGVVEQILKQAERLRQSILKKAFAGKLVPQDPNDESADKLLERIREERTRMNRNEKKVKIKNVNQLRLV